MSNKLLKRILFTFSVLIFATQIAFAATSPSDDCTSSHFPSLCRFFSPIKTQNLLDLTRTSDKITPRGDIKTARLTPGDNLKDVEPVNPTSPSELKKLTEDLKPKNNPLTEQQQLQAGMKEEYDPNFGKTLEQQRKNPPQPFPESALNQQPLGGFADGQSKFEGDFVCSGQGNGTFAGSGKDKLPKNQGGEIENELWYAAAAAAKSSGAKVSIVSGNRPGATVTGTGSRSKHADGMAIDVDIQGADETKTRFVLFFIANTKKFNSVGSYGGTMSHTHLGADCGPTWCPFKGKNPSNGNTGSVETWKKEAFLRAGLSEYMRPPKVVAWSGARRGAAQLCNQQSIPSV